MVLRFRLYGHSEMISLKKSNLFTSSMQNCLTYDEKKNFK
jgi:hypothetical protein